MKLKKILQYLMIAFWAIHLLSSCSDDTEAEPKFTKTPVERLDWQKSELNVALLSSEFGWKAVYFTDDTQLGGYTHLFKFSADGKVEMASDFDQSTTTAFTGEYDIQLGSTISLVFTTKNRIHLLSDSNNAPTYELNGKGYLGDFQFLYYGMENDELIFRTNRSSVELRFVKAKAEDWADLPKNFDIIPNIVGADRISVFRILETNDGTTKQQFDFSFTPEIRLATVKSEIEKKIGIGYTPNGFLVSPALIVGNQKLTHFVYDQSDHSFVATGQNGVSAILKYSSKPAVLTENYKMLLPGNSPVTFGCYPTLFSFKTDSEIFNEEFNKSKLYIVYIVFNDPTLGNFIRYAFADGTEIKHFFDVQEDTTEKKIIFKHKSWDGDNDALTPAILSDFDSYLMDKQGLYFKKQGVVFFGSDLYTLTSSTRSNFRITIFD